MLSVEEARSVILNTINLCDRNSISILNALHRILDEDIYSSMNIPSVPTSTRDGYGWNTKWNTSSKIKCNSQSNYAGASSDSNLDSVETMYIATGGIVPSQFDTVVMIEDVVYFDTEDCIQLAKQDKINIKKGQYIRAIGSDVYSGELLINKDILLTSAHIALLASIGIRSVKVKKVEQSSKAQRLVPYKIGILSTGNEVKDVFELSFDNKLKDGELYDSNRYMIMNRCKEIKLNLECIDLGIIRDNKEELISKIQMFYEKYDLDLIISTGGASVGKKDYTYDIISTLGKVHTTKVNMMPGKPLLFGSIGPEFECNSDKYFFGLAGNPVSSGVQFELFVLPFIKKCIGVNCSENIVKCILNFDATSNDINRPEYQRVKLIKKEGIFYAETTGKQNSSTLKNLVEANGLIVVPSGEKMLNKGKEVDCIVINDSYLKSTESEVIKEEVKVSMNRCKVGILTTSDRAYNGIYEDISGKAIEEYIKNNFFTSSKDVKDVGGKVEEFEIVYKCIPDEIEDCKKAISDLVKEGCGLILTTGGTGPALRDITAIVLKMMMHKELPGFGEQMRAMSLKYVPTAILSGQTAGIIYSKDKDGKDRGSLVINLPGSPKSIKECLDVVKGAIPYGVELAEGGFIETTPPAFRGKRK
jgi:molybdenum cofactor synthesis domain-containing protein